MQTVTHDEASALIADSPCTLEFRAVALEPDSTIVRSGGGLLLVDHKRTLAGAIGSVVARDVDGFFRITGKPRELLADRAAFEALKDRWSFTRAKIAQLDGDWKGSDSKLSELEIRPLRADDSLDHLSHDLLEELERERSEHAILAAFERGIAVSFAYSASMTETYADISIDTLAEFRRRGIARAVVCRLIDEVVRLGKVPVWGATEDNTASLALAASLGFTREAGELFVCEVER